MVAVLTGDIIHSRQVNDPNIWLLPLKEFLKLQGKNPKDWEIFRGDSFQLKLKKPELALHVAMRIKALVKSVQNNETDQRNALIDVRLSIGLGEEKNNATKITESNGTAYIHSGEQLEGLKKSKTNMAIKSAHIELDQTLNLMLKLASTIMDNWSVNSAALMNLVLAQPELTQQNIGEKLGIEQNSVSGRYRRACATEVLELEKYFREKIKELAS